MRRPKVNPNPYPIPLPLSLTLTLVPSPSPSPTRCDAAALACLVLHKGNPFDELVLDLSPLRSPERFTDAAAFCLSLPGAADGVIVEAGSSLSSELPTGDAGAGEAGEEGVQSGAELLAARADAFATEPIYRLPALAISWARPRSDAKALVRQQVQTAGAHSSPL